MEKQNRPRTDGSRRTEGGPRSWGAIPFAERATNEVIDRGLARSPHIPAFFFSFLRSLSQPSLSRAHGLFSLFPSLFSMFFSLTSRALWSGTLDGRFFFILFVLFLLPVSAQRRTNISLVPPPDCNQPGRNFIGKFAGSRTRDSIFIVLEQMFSNKCSRANVLEQMFATAPNRASVAQMYTQDSRVRRLVALEIVVTCSVKITLFLSYTL